MSNLEPLSASGFEMARAVEEATVILRREVDRLEREREALREALSDAQGHLLSLANYLANAPDTPICRHTNATAHHTLCRNAACLGECQPPFAQDHSRSGNDHLMAQSVQVWAKEVRAALKGGSDE